MNRILTAAKDATQQALAGADNEGQRVTAVCIGLNIGSCRTSQASTATRPAVDAGDGIPWPVKLFAVAVICPLLLGGRSGYAEIQRNGKP